jgi:hypothetical protein
MNQEPDAGTVDVDTEEWRALESEGDESSAAETYEQSPFVAGEEGWPDPAEPASAVAAERVQGRHARPRDLRRLQTAVLGVALVIAVGFALYFGLQLGSAEGEDATSGSGDLTSRLEQANNRLADTADELRDAQTRVVAAEAEARELQEQLDTTSAASEVTDGELAEAAEQLQAVSDSLAAARSQSEALASAVLGSVDPVDACVRAAAQVAEEADQIGRGQLAKQAREAAATCAAAQESVALAVSQARGVLSD